MVRDCSYDTEAQKCCRAGVRRRPCTTSSRFVSSNHNGSATASPIMSFLTAVTVSTLFFSCSVEAFRVSTANKPVISKPKVQATVVQQLEPLPVASSEKRKKAALEMDRQRIERALNGVVNSHVLEELMSNQFPKARKNINTSSINNGKVEKADIEHRPKGRPAFVPGAMNSELSRIFLENQHATEMYETTTTQLSDPEIAAISPYFTTSDMDASISKIEQQTRKSAISKKASAVSSTSKNSKGTDVPQATVEAKPDNVLSATQSIQEEVQADTILPLHDRTSKHASSTYNYKVRSTIANQKNGILDPQYSYRTELLTADEEYSFGMKVNFMMKCEEVHEGLGLELERLPTIVEWAAACGFTESEDSFVATEADETLRPAGSESMFDRPDPSQFVGNGQAGVSGPGRGRGRVKKTPMSRLSKFFDDSAVRREMRKLPTSEQEQYLLQQIKFLKPINRGTPTQFVEMLMEGREAKKQMVKCNMRLVVSIARKHRNAGVSLQDLIQEGSLGLSRAAEKFEPQKGFKFATYASWWIQQAVFRSIAYHSRTIRLPVHVHNLLNRVRKVRATLRERLGRSPTNEEMAEKLEMTLTKYNKMMKLTRASISLEEPKYNSNPKNLGSASDDLIIDSVTSGDGVLDENTPETRVDRSLFHEDLREMLDILDEDERRVICARYGLTDGLTRTVAVIASQMKRTKSWVRSQECRGLRKLRRPWYEKKLKEHQDALTA